MKISRETRTSTRPQVRRGAAMVEVAIYLPIFLLLVLVMIELALLVFRYNWVSQTARQGARMAIVRGSMAPGEGATPIMNAWGPATYEAPATATDEIMRSFQPFMTLLDPAQTAVRLEWPDSNNDPGSKVRVTVTTSHTGFVSAMFAGTSWQLSGSSMMEIVH
jgi:Flp pilus assembly protein TadG